MSGNLKQSDPSPRSHGDLIYELESMVLIGHVPVYGKTENSDGLIALKPGTLNDTSQSEPRVAICLKSAQAWFELPDHTEKIQEHLLQRNLECSKSS